MDHPQRPHPWNHLTATPKVTSIDRAELLEQARAQYCADEVAGAPLTCLRLAELSRAAGDTATLAGPRWGICDFVQDTHCVKKTSMLMTP
jgi:hypothetical protein